MDEVEKQLMMQEYPFDTYRGSIVGRELVESGFQVRAGVRDISKGQVLLEVCLRFYWNS